MRKFGKCGLLRWFGVHFWANILTREGAYLHRKYKTQTSPSWIPIVVCSCMHAFSWKWDPMRTPPFRGVRIGSHSNTNTWADNSHHRSEGGTASPRETIWWMLQQGPGRPTGYTPGDLTLQLYAVGPSRTRYDPPGFYSLSCWWSSEPFQVMVPNIVLRDRS